MNPPLFRRRALRQLSLVGLFLLGQACGPGDGASNAGTGGDAGIAGTVGTAGTGGGDVAGSAGTTGAAGTATTGTASGNGGDVGAAGSSGTAGSGGTPAPGGRGGLSGSGGAAGGAGAGGTGSGGSSALAGSTGTGGGGGGAAGGGGRSGTGGRGGGAAGTSGGAGTGGSAGTYQPCPSNGVACKILPLGDSITYGVNDEGNGGYRGPLFAATLAAGQKITFTGSLSNGPNTVSGQTFPKRNEGHNGWGISQVTPYSNGNAGIATVIPNPAFSSGSGGTPDIILLGIGTNDQGSFPATQMISDLKGLLDKIISNAPNALLVIAQIIPLGYGTNDVIKAYNQAIPGVVQERAAAGKHIVLVDMYTGFTTSTMLGSDNIHPNTTGYRFMADRWYAAIGSLLPK